MLNVAQSSPWVLALLAVVPAAAGAVLVLGRMYVQARAKLQACQAWLRTSEAEARGSLALRDSLIGESREAVAVWSPGATQPLCFGNAAALVEASLNGPDRDAVSAALAALREDGVAFTLDVRDSRNHAVGMRGCLLGGYAALFLQVEQKAAPLALDCIAALEAVPLPVWLRGPDFRLKWANHAFSVAMGAQSLQQAIEADFAFDRSERDLAASARESGRSIAAERYAFVHGHRRALSISAHPLPDGSIVGMARNLVPDSGTELLRQTSDAYAYALDQLDIGVAIFGADRRMIFVNQSLAKIMQVDFKWLSRHPSQNEILDHLRELRQMPEQIDFAAWKRERGEIFDPTAAPADELWHLPDGRGLRLVRQPLASGGIIVFLEDVTATLRLEAANNALIKVQKATLDTLQEACAVFGPDGRLKASNGAFARLWRLTEEELDQQLHINRIGELCVTRTGQDGIWDIVASEVTSASGERHKEWFRLERLDGRMLSLALTRLPDGSVLASFADITDFCRLASALDDSVAVA